MFNPIYIQVILPIAVRGVFTYRCPVSMVPEIEIGKRVVVPFGQKRYYAGLVYKKDVALSKGLKPKDVAYILDEYPVINDAQLTFWEWMAQYYMSGLGAVMNAAFPNAMKLSSQTTIALNPSFEEFIEMSDDERMVLANIRPDASTYIKDLERLGSKKMIQRTINSLMKKGVVVLNEELDELIKPKLIVYVELNASYASEGKLKQLLDDLEQAPKQLEAVMRYLAFQKTNDFRIPVKRSALTQVYKISSAVLKSLIEKGVFELIEMYENAMFEDDLVNYQLNENQLNVIRELNKKFDKQKVALLHGVTGSGKTLVYAELIKQNAEQGKQTLFLVPEIALTTQLVQRLTKLIGEEIVVYHSKRSNKERLTAWLKLLESGGSEVIIGARSSVFLPFNNLGLVIVDEEHEPSFKQHESSPHYHARDAAIWLANQQHARTVIGSATPAIESMFNAKRGKYALAKLNQRHDQVQMPLISVIDMTKSKRAETVGSSFSGELVEAIKRTLFQGRQVILFQNRRGYSPYIICETCGWTGDCINCDVNLTYHKFFDKMLCHYCGYGIKKPVHCPSCGSAKLTLKGFGTEKLELELEQLFPKARIARMDLDTTRKKHAFQKLMDAFEERSLDILVGTQMVAKGLDFEHVGLVGVMNADALWNRPDFRAFERSFQLLTQVAGRAGRKRERGEVLIQTYRPEHPVINFVVNQGYDLMYTHQLSERQQFDYPPFVRMIKFEFAHPDPNRTKEAAQHFANLLRKHFKSGVLGPEEPSVPRIRGRFLRQLFLKHNTSTSISEVRKTIWNCVDHHEGSELHRSVQLRIDVDPY